jgi:hypothetical protein
MTNTRRPEGFHDAFLSDAARSATNDLQRNNLPLAEPPPHPGLVLRGPGSGGLIF